MTVSIFLPTHARNVGGSLSRAISSILGQSYDNFELIVLDDASRDGTESTIQSFMALDRRVSTVRFETNIGLPALTSGSAYTRSAGKYICWQFDDCEWLPGHLEALIAAAEASPEAGLVYGRAEIVHANGTTELLGSPTNFSELEHGGNTIPNCATLVRREIHERLGWLDPHILLKRNCDWDMWTRIAEHYPLLFVDKILAREYGPSLGDSLGNSVGIEADLMLRYCKLDRREALRPANLAARSPFQPPAKLEVSDADRHRLAALILQHFARVGQPDKALPEIAMFAPELEKTWRMSAPRGISVDEMAASLSSAVWIMNESIRNLNRQRNESNDYIQYQRHILDERLEIIKTQEIDISILNNRLNLIDTELSALKAKTQLSIRSILRSFYRKILW